MSEDIPLPPPSYTALSISPVSFPAQPNWPWVRDLHQLAMVVYVVAATPPTYIRFRDRNGLDYEAPVSGATDMGFGHWSLATPHTLIPHILAGPCTLAAGDHALGIESNAVAGDFP